MKKFLITFVLISTTLFGNCTDNNQNKKINLHLNMANNSNSRNVGRSYGNTGAGLMGAGAMFLLVGFTTNTEVYGTTPNQKNFFEQPGRAAAVITGGLLLGTGIVISIGR
jgi:hypothetical protein